MDLPDLLTALDGQQVKNSVQWPARRQELLQLVLDNEYGAFPSAASFSSTLVDVKDGGSCAVERTYRLRLDTLPAIQFDITMYLPEGAMRHPVVLNGDACWKYINEEIISTVTGRGYILATFDRTAIAPDGPDPQRESGLYSAFPGMDFGALTAWAWGYQRVIDFLLTLPEVDGSKIAISGHSRGGKAVLLAGATDERIALTNPNDSGCAGAGCFRIQGEGSETLADIVSRFPYWFNQRLPGYFNRENELPFDQHFLKAAVAPRLYLSTEALGDLWANPSGTWHSHQAARIAFDLVGVPENIAIWYRQGQHQHSLADFTALLGFADWRYYGNPLPEGYNQSPFG